MKNVMSAYALLLTTAQLQALQCKYLVVTENCTIHLFCHTVLISRRPLGRPRRRWEDNIKMDLQKVGGGYGDWMELAQDRDKWHL